LRDPEARRLKGKDREKSNRWYKALRKGTDVENNVKKRRGGLEKEEKRLNEEIVKSGKPGTKILESFYSASWEEMVNELLPEE